MKNILLAVTGLSPQVVTETLYALHQNNRRVDAVHVITTMEGKEKIYAELLSGKTGQFYRYMEDYNIDPGEIDFGHKNIHVITDENGNEIPDIMDESHNELLLKKCMDLVFMFTKDPDTALFLSIAGGRKTMSACLTLAAQMYGRPQDRLYHVLVSPEFEGSRNFYYPPRESRLIELRDRKGQPFFKETGFARINLIHIPFVSIRERLSNDMLKEPADPATLMLSLVREEKYRLRINLMEGKISYKSVELDMMPAHLALYAFFATRKKECTRERSRCGTCTDCFLDIQAIYRNQDKITGLYRQICGYANYWGERKDTGITCLDDQNFNMYKSKIKKSLLYRFGPYAIDEIGIVSTGRRPHTRYGIPLDRERIEIVY